MNTTDAWDEVLEFLYKEDRAGRGNTPIFALRRIRFSAEHSADATLALKEAGLITYIDLTDSLRITPYGRKYYELGMEVE